MLAANQRHVRIARADNTTSYDVVSSEDFISEEMPHSEEVITDFDDLPVARAINADSNARDYRGGDSGGSLSMVDNIFRFFMSNVARPIWYSILAFTRQIMSTLNIHPTIHDT